MGLKLATSALLIRSRTSSCAVSSAFFSSQLELSLKFDHGETVYWAHSTRQHAFEKIVKK